eukprot:TRINITY_DN3512_c0_g3_i2.p1 TRINITY_DN3512_c0_g3~~TRINITY_DN3512_c0_g3_i2.p1  ORF type:complete len:2058 (-),score=751.90 TRINITY_DN3512_c0_g3_i2:12-6110(-)
MDASSFTVQELRSELEERGVDTKGIKLKAKLVEMLEKIWNDKEENSGKILVDKNGETVEMEVEKEPTPRVASIIGKKFADARTQYLVQWDLKEFDNEWLVVNEDGRLPVEMVEEYEKKWWEAVEQKLTNVKEVHEVTYKTKCCSECAVKGVKSCIYAVDIEGIKRHVNDFPLIVSQIQSFSEDVLRVGNEELFKYWVQMLKDHKMPLKHVHNIPKDVPLSIFQLYLQEIKKKENFITHQNLAKDFMTMGRPDIVSVLLELIYKHEQEDKEEAPDFGSMSRREIARWKRDEKEPKNLTPLHLKALSAVDPKELEGILNGKSVKAQAFNSYLPIHFASLNPNPEIIEAIMKAGGKLEGQDTGRQYYGRVPERDCVYLSLHSKNDGVECTDFNKTYRQFSAELEEAKRREKEEKLKKEREEAGTPVVATRSERVRNRRKMEEMMEEEEEKEEEKEEVEVKKEENEELQIQIDHLRTLDVPTMQEHLFTLGLDDSDAPKQQLFNRLLEAVKAGKKICYKPHVLERKAYQKDKKYVFPPQTSRTFLKVLSSKKDLSSNYLTEFDSDDVALFEGLCNFQEHNPADYISQITADTPKRLDFIIKHCRHQLSQYGNASALLLNALKSGTSDVVFQKLLIFFSHHQMSDSLIGSILEMPQHLNALGFFLQETGASVRVSANREDTPLFKAVHLGYDEAVQLIAKQGADVNEVLHNGISLLVYSLHGGHFHISHKLKDLGAKIFETVEENEGESMDLDQVADIKFLKEISEPLFKGYVFVLSGIFRREMSTLAQFVIQHGAEVSKTPNGKMTHLLLGSTGMTEYGSITGPGSKKYSEAMALNPKVVTEKWIDEQVKKRSRDRAIYLGEGTLEKETQATFWTLFFTNRYKQKNADQLLQSVNFLLENGAELKKKGENSILDSFINGVVERPSYTEGDSNSKTLLLILERAKKEAPEIISERNSEGLSPLALAITRNKFQFARELMGAPGVDLNEIVPLAENKQFGGQSILHLISNRGELSLFQHAINLGADPNAVSTDKTPLIIFSVSRIPFFEYLWSLPQVNVNVLNANNTNVLQALFASGWNGDLLELMNNRRGEAFDYTGKINGRTLLHVYSEQNLKSITNLKYILALPGININQRDTVNTTPLLRYIHRNEAVVAVMLIEAGAELNDKNALLRPFAASLQLGDPTLSNWISRSPKLDRNLALEDASLYCSTSNYFFKFFDQFGEDLLNENLRTLLVINVLNNSRNRTDRDMMLKAILGQDAQRPKNGFAASAPSILANVFKNHPQLFDNLDNNMIVFLFGFIVTRPELLVVESVKGELMLQKMISFCKADEHKKKTLLDSFKKSPSVLLTPSSVFNGKNVFHSMAEKRESIEMFEELVKINPEGINSVDNEGNTPLSLALSGNQFNVTKWADLTAKYGADPFLRPKSGVSAVQKAVEKPYFLSSKILASFISNIKDENKKKELQNALEETLKRTKAESEAKKAKRSKKIAEFAAKKKEMDGQVRTGKKEMKRAGSLGHLTDARGLSKTFEVPFIATVEGKWKVLVEEEKNIWDTTLNLVNIKAFIHGTNKYILQQLLVNEEPPKKNLKGAMIPYMGPKYMVLRESGTIGNPVKPKNERKFFHELSDAKQEFEGHFLEATGNAWKDRLHFKKQKGKFAMVQKIYDVKISKETLQKDREESKLNPEVMDLIEIISDLPMIRQAMKQAGLDWSALPLGRVSSAIIEKALQILKDIDEAQIQIEENYSESEDSEKIKGLKAKIDNLSNEYYTLIPRDLSTSDTRSITEEQEVTDESRLLENLRDIGTAVDLITAPPGINKGLPRFDAIADGICSNIVPLDTKDEEAKRILKWTGNDGVKVFKVSRFDETSRFEPFREERSRDLPGSPNNLLLFHGTRTANVLGILRHGLRIAPPTAPRSGLAFGKGVYFSDSFQKSYNYCGANGNTPNFMFICEVAVGTSLELQSGKYMEQPEPGTNSTKGLGRTVPDPQQTVILPNGVGVPCGPTITTSEKNWLAYNEFIVYDESRVKIKYLIKFNDHRKKE